jgi:single-stranded DNA-binding protein
MNQWSLVGTVLRPPTTRVEGDGHQSTDFTLAVDEHSYGAGHKPYVLFVPCTSWGKSAEACSLLNAVDLVSVQGKLTWRKHAAQNSQTHSQLVVSVREVPVLEAAAEEPV